MGQINHQFRTIGATILTRANDGIYSNCQFLSSEKAVYFPI